MAKTPEPFGLRMVCAIRDNAAILTNHNWSGGKIFLFLGFVPEINFAVCLDDDLVIGASRHIDCSKIDIDNEFPTGRYVELTRNILFSRRRSGDHERE
jgi:hypothetical protein